MINGALFKQLKDHTNIFVFSCCLCGPADLHSNHFASTCYHIAGVILALY